MKKIYNMMQIACSFILISMIFSTCIKDSGMRKTRIFTPVLKTSEEVRTAIKNDIDVAEGNGIWRNGNFYSTVYPTVDDVFYAATSYDGSKSNPTPAPAGVV